MRAAPVPSEHSSTAGRDIRPAVPNSPGGIVPPVHTRSSYVTGRHEQAMAFGPRTILPCLRRGIAPPSVPATGRVIRPAVRTSGVMPPVHNQPVSRYVTGRNGKDVGNGPRTILPYLLR
eukprot:3484471-Prymnesium_polylepis.1